VNVCGDVVFAIYGPETMTVGETPTAAAAMPQTATAAAAAAAADSVMTSAKLVELNIPEILVHN